MHNAFKLLTAGLLTGLLFGCSTAGNASMTPPVPPAGPAVTDATTAIPQTATTTTTDSTMALPMSVTASVPKHVLTGDYFESPWGTTSVTPSRALPYLDYVRTAISNATELHNDGFRVQLYTNANRLETRDPLYAKAAAAISKTCGSARVYNHFAGLVQYVATPADAALKSAFAAQVATNVALGHIDQVFMDNVGALADFGVTFYPSLPCSYSDAAWIAGERELADASSVPVIFNGLSALHNHGVSLGVQVISASRVAGGEYEHCFSDATHPEQGSWPWTATENTQLQVTAASKQFHCQSVNTAEAAASYPSRIYTLASFLLTYNPNYSVLWEEYGTPSGLHVMPESGFVALDPVTHPTNADELKEGSGVYVRKYAHCYYRGSLVGACAMVVNPDYYAHPVALTGYHHTLRLSGAGAIDGGTVSFSGPPPASSLAATSAYIALP